MKKHSVNLQNTLFVNANLRGSLFWGCDLREVDFTGANLTGAQIIACDIRSAIFKDAITDNLDLSGSVYTSKPHYKDNKEHDRRVRAILEKSRRNFPLKNYRVSDIDDEMKELEVPL